MVGHYGVPMFEIGKQYQRSKLHDEFGGNRQNGISTIPKHPFIFIFSGGSGESHGYVDGWDEENYYHYSGEGQTGDMKFIRGNRALRDHANEEKAVHLFEKVKSGSWKYVDQLELFKWNEFDTHDTNGKMRKGIEFIFRSATGKSVNKEGKPREAPRLSKPNSTERKGLVTSRVGQGWYRQEVLHRWGRKCAVTGCDIENILIASHIVPWKDASDEERLDPANGILLSPVYDALFDRHLISFTDDGSIQISKRISQEGQQSLGISASDQLLNVSTELKAYLSRHREVFDSFE